MSLATNLQDKMEEWREQIDPGLVLFIERSQDRLATEYVKATLELAAYWGEVRPFFEEYDLLLTPTVLSHLLRLARLA